jgi:hypothetical protein
MPKAPRQLPQSKAIAGLKIYDVKLCSLRFSWESSNKRGAGMRPVEKFSEESSTPRPLIRKLRERVGYPTDTVI